MLKGLRRAAIPAAAAALFLGLVADWEQSLAQGRRPVDLELVLAVDSSSSVSPGEFNLQMQGLAQAFRSPDVQTSRNSRLAASRICAWVA